MVSTRPPTSKSSSPFNNPLVTIPKAPITIGIIVTFMFHRFFSSLARSKYLSFSSHSFSFILWSVGTAKSTILQILFFCWLLFGLVFWPRLGDQFANASLSISTFYSLTNFYIYYLYIVYIQIKFCLVNNLHSPKLHLNFFFYFFWNYPIQSSLFYAIAVFNLIRQFISKVY